MVKYISLIILSLFFELTMLYSQSGSEAVPFLLNSPSAEFSAMGEATIAVESDNPFALFWNPAHLGIQSLNNTGNVGISNSSFSPAYLSGEISYTTRVYKGGINLSTLHPFPLDLSFGFAYSNIENDLGDFNETRDDPTVLNVFHAEEFADQFTVSAGVKYRWLQGAFGVTFKTIDSRLAPFNVQGQGRQGVADAIATDWGAFIGCSLVDAISDPSVSKVRWFDSLSPFLNFTLGYAIRNLGDEVSYIDVQQADPLPRTVHTGIGINMGFMYDLNGDVWKPFSVRWSLDASDLLINRWEREYYFDDTGSYHLVRKEGWEYRNGLGDIKFGNDILLGNSNNAVEQRKGWEVNFFELFSYRGGRIEDHEGGRFVSTEGYGFQLLGAFKIISWLAKDEPGYPFFRWVVKHVNFIYNRSINSSTNPLENDRVYNEYLFSVRGW